MMAVIPVVETVYKFPHIPKSLWGCEASAVYSCAVSYVTISHNLELRIFSKLKLSD